MDQNLGGELKLKRGRTKRSLTLDELKMAALICFRNADEILEDAELLYSHKRYARTVFLSCIGMEELGKSTLCLELFEANWQFDTDDKIKKFWNFWYHHLSKTAHGLGYIALDPNLLEKGGRDLLPKKYLNWEDYEEHKRNFYREFSSLTTDIKENSLYVDFFDRNKRNKRSGFSLPSQTFKNKHAEQFLRELRKNVDDLRPHIRNLGWLNLPPYPPDLKGEAW
ncbi:MAG: AbiV family abortive infection protein [Elusimicrobiota bacterium]